MELKDGNRYFGYIQMKNLLSSCTTIMKLYQKIIIIVLLSVSLNSYCFSDSIKKDTIAEKIVAKIDSLNKTKSSNNLKELNAELLLYANAINNNYYLGKAYKYYGNYHRNNQNSDSAIYFYRKADM